MYSASFERFKALHARSDLKVVLYGSLPDSPFNGGRPNFLLDGVAQEALVPLTRQKTTTMHSVLKTAMNCLAGFSETQLAKAIGQFWARVEEANREQMQYYLAVTNLHIAPDELTEQNLAIFERLVQSGDQHGVKNAIILSSDVLEDKLRAIYGNRFEYVSSCTKYYDQDRILPASVTLERYLADAPKYDRVVLTPQDSYDLKVMTAVCATDAAKFSVVADVMCDRTCNAYNHYDMISRYNKTSLKDIRFSTLLPYSLEYMQLDCPITANRTLAMPLLQRVPLQLQAGVTHFKIGRAFSTDMATHIDQLLAVLQGPLAA